MITGKVISGLGKGESHVVHYLSHFENVLGFTCFPGTLNIRVAAAPLFSNVKKYSIVPGGLGQVDCYLVKINEIIDGAIVVPHKTEHDPDVIEIIAAVNLREKLQLHDGDEVTCELV
jgi:riboflavin kinase, archaea type